MLDVHDKVAKVYCNGDETWNRIDLLRTFSLLHRSMSHLPQLLLPYNYTTTLQQFVRRVHTPSL